MIVDIQNVTIEVIQPAKKLILCKNLSFFINPGETVGILGESGSGKSMTALSVLRLLPPSIKITQGKINFTRKDGSVVNLVEASYSELQGIRGKEISMVFQEPMTSLNPAFSCGDQVLETIFQHQKILGKEAKKRVLELFEKVKLSDPQRIYTSYPHQLSGGQKQRVMIAIAISCNPGLLIADEPTTALDVTVQKSILELLKEIQEEMKMAIIFITHDINVVAEIAKRLLVFYKGEIVEQGDVVNILEHPKHIYTQGLMNCRTSAYKKGQRLKTLDDANFGSDIRDMKVSDFVVDNRLFDLPVTSDSALSVKQERASILQICNLNVSFSRYSGFFGHNSKNQILKNVSFEVFQGETLGLVGESGSGKTTIGRSIMKLVESESGDILYKGKKIDILTGNELRSFRKNVQIIFQDPYSSLNPKMTIGDMISEPLIVHGLFKDSNERKIRALKLLREVGLNEEYYNRYPHQSSGGQRQRIGIARALAVEPELIILDESVSALDVSIQAQILNLLNDLKREYNFTYIFISHDLNTVRFMADRVIVLKEGAVIEQGTSDGLFSNPQNSYTRNLIFSTPGHR
ncbi:MAG TPA: ABC transporter ATP-binding protein [Bacteroidales bacterium]